MSTIPEEMRERVKAIFKEVYPTGFRLGHFDGIMLDVYALLEETDRKAREDFAMKVFTVKTERLFDGGELFIKRKPIEQIVINELSYEAYKAIQEAADAFQSLSKESK